MNSRIDRINELIGQKISLILHDDILELDQYFAVTHVETTPDLSYCDINISFLKNAEETISKINSNQKQINKTLASLIKLRKTPRLRFHIDESSEQAEKIERLFQKI